MKVSYKQLTYLVLFSALPFSLNAQRLHTGNVANEKFSNAEVVRDSKFSNLPSYVQFRKSNQFDIDELKQWMVSNFKFNSGTGFDLIREDIDNLGHVHYRYQQTLDGKPIEDAIWIAHTNQDKVYSLNGLIYQKIETSKSAGLTEEGALDKALEHIGATSYKWELPGEEAHLKWETDNEDATYLPKGELVFVSENYSFSSKQYALAYKFNIYAHAPVSRSEIYVDANTGEIIRKNDLICHADEPGVAHTAYSGEKDIIADSFGGEFRLRDASRGDGVRTFDLNESTSYGDAVDFIDDDNDWDNVNPQKDEYATDAHWGSEMTYDYYFDEHGRNSIDNDGFQLNSYVHYSSDFDNAFWDGSRMTYGDGDVAFTPLTSIDVAGHEVTHGLTTFTAGLVYAMESGALNESFSDVFGTAIEFFGRPEDADWLIGADIGLSGPLRSMSNPNSEGDPDTYFGDFWADLDGGDSGGVHTNSGVQNFWYYLLTEGGVGTNDNGDDYDVTGIGMEASSAIAFRNLTVYLTSSSQYEDARFFAIQSAVDLYGICTIEVAETGNAWYAVGVGDEYNPIALADFYTSDTLGCELPHEVTFINTSESASDYAWDFGDGETSTEESPVHTYTEAGTFTVTLTVSGGDCGDDELVLVDYITVNPDSDCIVIMPETGTGEIQTTCTGILFDSGGPGADYGDDEDAEITISPDGAVTVDLSFPSFDIEDGPGLSCDYDYLEIYDGPNTLAPLIGRYCNDNLPTDMTSSGESITILFHSDGDVEEDGFEIYWSCNVPEEEPTASFSSNSEFSCDGTVHFVDQSTNLPIEWLWNFGDGETSTEQNPSHTYDAEGTYNVTLVATNIIGSDEHVEMGYIMVDFVEEPTTTGDNFCQSQTATLGADGSHILEWYDEPIGGNIVNTGSTYITPVLDETTSYYVTNRVASSEEYVGAEDNTFGGGGFFLGEQHLIFNAPIPFILKSVDVYANGSGERSIQLRDNEGEIIETVVVDVPDGASTVILDLQVPSGSNLQLGTAEGSTPNLFRNNTGTPAFPYTLPGSVEILSSSAGDDYYYFFYNWQILAYDCKSDRIAVTAHYVDCLGIDEETETSISIYPNPTNGIVNVNTGDLTNGTIKISNVLGQSIATIAFNSPTLTINLADYQARGTYFVSFYNENDDLVTIKRIVRK